MLYKDVCPTFASEFQFDQNHYVLHLPSLSHHTMPSLLSILSHHSILGVTAQYLSLLDLFRLATTCSELYALIRNPDELFEHWKRITLCDGRGLKARQAFRGVYASIKPGCGRPIYDEEVEVRVWNLRCDAFNALPCLKCGLNVCEVGILSPSLLIVSNKLSEISFLTLDPFSGMPICSSSSLYAT
jgi:hypothetical protein